MKDHDFKNPRGESWSNLISLGFKEKVGGRVGVWGGYHFTTTCSYVLRT